MDRCEKLRDNLYGVELLTGSITPVKEHIAQIFYIVNNTDNSEFIENEALQMITQFGKTEYHFCGRHSELWQRIFNDTALKIYPTDSEKVITRKYESTEKFADELSLVLQERFFVPTDFYLIYDDEEMYKQVVGMTE